MTMNLVKRSVAGLGLLGVAFMASGCMGSDIDKAQVGTVLGGIGGGLLGSQVGKGNGNTAAIIGGTLLGSMVGKEVGASLDRADRAYANQAFNQATTAPIGNQIRWNNRDSGNRGSVTPVRDGTDNRGRYCREYQTTIVVGGKQQQGYGTACRQPDGQWQIQP